MGDQYRPERDQAETGRQETAQRVGLELRLRRLEKPALKQTDVAKPTEQQVKEATKELSKIRELRPEVWKGLDNAKRLEVLQNVEKQMAEIQDRPPVKVKVEKMDPGDIGGYTRATREISISESHLRSNDTREILDTMVHEGRHAYQHHATDHPGFHPNKTEVDAWRRNFGDYKTIGRDGAKAYMRQPIEADAWGYAGKIVPKARGGSR